jgi:hypothetical protein
MYVAKSSKMPTKNSMYDHSRLFSFALAAFLASAADCAFLPADFLAPLADFAGAVFLAVFFFAELVPLFFAAISNTFSFP